MDDKFSIAFDSKSIFCLKGVEIDLSTSSVFDTEIKHGLSQLQYALPRLVAETIEFNMGSHLEECCPFLYCPILLTTSEIFVARADTTIEKVEQADKIEDFATRMPWIVMFSDQSPEFQRHRSITCSDLDDLLGSGSMMLIDETRRQAGVYETSLPSVVCQHLSGGYSKGLLNRFFGQTIVCSLANFETLLIKLKAVGSQTDKTRHPLPFAVAPTE